MSSTVDEPGTQPALIISTRLEPSTISYSFNSLLSTRAFPLRRSLWWDGGGASGRLPSWVLSVEMGSERDTSERVNVRAGLRDLIVMLIESERSGQREGLV